MHSQLQGADTIPPSHVVSQYYNKMFVKALSAPQPTITHSLEELQQAIQTALFNALAQNTRRTYRVGVRCNLIFCFHFSLPPLPPSEQVLMYFISHLARTVSIAMLKVYLAGVRMFFIEQGVPDPFRQFDTIRQLQQGIQRQKGQRPSQHRLPITPGILRKLRYALRRDENLHPADKTMLWVAFTTAFFAFLRASGFTSPGTFQPSHHLSGADIRIDSNQAKIHLKVSKTD